MPSKNNSGNIQTHSRSKAETNLPVLKNIRGFVDETGSFTLFTADAIKQSFLVPLEFGEFLRQCYMVGNRSVWLIAITGGIMGAVLTIQSRPVLNEFGAEAMLPEMVSISLVREIGPVITALLCAGKAGSGMGAELGSMKVTEQIEAMEVSSANPMRFLVATRVMACVFMLPLLVMFADGMGLLGSWFAANLKADVNIALYFAHAFSVLDFIDFFPAFIKSFVFGGIIGLVGCYTGYRSGKGTESVGTAANSAVVISSLLIIITDLIAAQITDIIP